MARRIVEWYYLTPERQVPILNSRPGDTPAEYYARYNAASAPDTVESNLWLVNSCTHPDNAQFLVEDTGRVHVVWPGQRGKRRQSCYPDLDTALMAVLVQR